MALDETLKPAASIALALNFFAQHGDHGVFIADNCLWAGGRLTAMKKLNYWAS